jgi:hypothetical protein
LKSLKSPRSLNTAGPLRSPRAHGLRTGARDPAPVPRDTLNERGRRIEWTPSRACTQFPIRPPSRGRVCRRRGGRRDCRAEGTPVAALLRLLLGLLGSREGCCSADFFGARAGGSRSDQKQARLEPYRTCYPAGPPALYS